MSKLRTWGVLDTALCWAQCPQAKPWPAPRLLQCLCPMPAAWLSSPPPQAEPIRSLQNNYAVYLVAFGATGIRELHPAHRKQMEEGQWSLPWGTEVSQDKASRRRSPVLAQRLVVLPWASLLKIYMIQHQSPDLKGVSWSSVHLDTSYSALIYLCDMGNMVTNFSFFCCLQGSTMWAVSVQEQPLLVAPERVISPVLSTREGYFPGTSRREPATSWQHPAFTIRCLWFNKDSWGQTTVLFISPPEKTNENNFSLPAKIFLWQLLNFHWKWKHKMFHEN